MALLFDPVSIGVDDPAGDMIDYDLGTGDLIDTTMDSYVYVDGNIEIIVLFDPFMDVLSCGHGHHRGGERRAGGRVGRGDRAR